LAVPFSSSTYYRALFVLMLRRSLAIGSYFMLPEQLGHEEI